ncbi:DUF397 domain-containing protein [Streptomyces sp. RY43-2]|uniref:DUF397 domain-containing protein n=1 Tax=Streptomyces macrolidinus TaxID=2952607 RepID=A0ABT0Z7U8_9ACTN|nr:DUF397 domain-containing protein [Streptomyces macrolidinus]MCN9239565.1 DUF397 domain-containing protein [Streptomyces macrolidinus]
MATDSLPLIWFKSSYSGNGGSCIEVATNLVASCDTVPVRDSKNPNGPVLNFPTAAFSSFVTSLKRGQLGSD